MPMKLLSADEVRNAAKDGARPDGTVFRFTTADPQMQDDETRTVRFVFSDATVDHAGDSIDPKGWDLGIFNRNPVALWAHMSWDPPIGTASNVGVLAGKLAGDIEFADADTYPFADTIYRLVKGKFLRATSVGFLPKEWAFSSDKDRPYGIDFKKQTLLEISVCPVPCNPSALGQARGMGIDTAPLVEWAEKVLDSGDTVFLPRAEVEALRGQSGAAVKRFYIQADKAISAELAERIRDRVKAWQQDPEDVLVLGQGLTLRTVGADSAASTTAPEATPVNAEAEAAQKSLDELIEDMRNGEISFNDVHDAMEKVVMSVKAGRRISAANMAKMQEAIGHHEAATKCIKDIMDGDGPDNEPDGDPDDSTVIMPQPPGTVVVESDDHLTPEQRRLKEARALKASIPIND